jgi:ectoine hydroxylase-related dioxygenase (phytanoyl-CoA dioxygenase family)
MGYLSAEQIASYHRDGYVALPRVLDMERVDALRRVTEAFVERSRGLAKSEGAFDLDPRHTAAAPVLRRIKDPADHDPLYRWVAFDSPIPDIVTELIGPSIRFHHSKLNLKGSLIGAPVEVHQDAAFYPHSNDDVLAVGLLLDDATEENGALAVLPGSHRGPIHSHYDEPHTEGRHGSAGAPPSAGGIGGPFDGPPSQFVGCMRAADVARLDRSRAPLLTLPAGSIHIHHYRLVHWSAPNTSPGERRLLINAYAAADAISLVPDTTGSPLCGHLVRGTEPRLARRTAGEMPLPPDFRQGYTSIYELQRQAAAAKM